MFSITIDVNCTDMHKKYCETVIGGLGPPECRAKGVLTLKL